MATDRYHAYWVDENGREQEDTVRADSLSEARKIFNKKRPEVNLLSIQGDVRRNN